MASRDGLDRLKMTEVVNFAGNRTTFRQLPSQWPIHRQLKRVFLTLVYAL